jgi:ABC-type dipeptide/oligopeptide/nickel transport system permease subunit
MLSGGREFLEVAPHLVVAPGVAISLLVFAFNIFGDGLRDRLDPRHHGRGSA